MTIRIGEDSPPPPSKAEILAPWLRRFLIGGCLIWVCFSIQNFLEDARTHTIKITYPLLLGRETITSLQPGFDPQKAVWKPINTGFLVPDGTILFVRTGDHVYAVKIVHQAIKPEAALYEFLRVGTSDPVVTAIAESEPGGITLPEHRIGWSGKSDGAGYLYLDDSFIWNRSPRYTIGVPFQSGDLEQFRHAVPADVHFESLPWKINAGGGDDVIAAP